MGAISNWMYVDLFTVDQAAALWAGYDPVSLRIVDSMKPSEVVAAKQMLISGITRNELRADSSKNALSMIGDYSKSLVARADLERFARARKVFPIFLFDTMAPIVAKEDVFHANPARLAGPVEPPPPTPTSRGGRPQEHDWDTFLAEIVRRANQPDGLPETQAQLVHDMLEWFQKSYGREPAESAVKARISKIYRHLEEATNPDA